MHKKKVLLLNPPTVNGEMVIKDQYCSFTSKAGYYWIPIDLLVLSGDLAQHFEVNVIDSIIDGKSEEETLKKITDFSPDHIVLLSSLITHESDRSLVNKLRKKIKFTTTFIGDIFYFSFKEMIKYEEVDSIIYEYPCPELVSYIQNGTADCNIVYKESGEPVFLPTRKPTEILYHTPAHHLFDLKKYSVPFMREDLCTSVLTNFGCKYTCNYCPADSVSFRERPILAIIEEINQLDRMGIKNIWIRDFTFGLNKERTKEFLNAIKPLGISWFCLTRSEILDSDLINSMVLSGCYLIMVGVDSSDEQTMKRINRRQNTSELKNKIALADAAGMNVLVHMILGFPEDGIKNMLRTIHFLASTRASFLSINFFSPRAGSAYFKNESIHSPISKVLDSNYAEHLGSKKEMILLTLLKYYALILFYFNLRRVTSILTKIKSKKQFLTIVKTGVKMFVPALR